MKRVGILTAIWGRHDLTRVVLEWYAGMYVPGYEFTLLAVGSEWAKSEELALSSGWEYIQYDNLPLSDKWNAGMEALKGRGLDGVVIVGSDDLISAAYFDAVAEHIRNGSTVVGLEDLYWYDVSTGDCMYDRRVHPGAGMYVSSKILDRVGWEPWPRGYDTMLDGAMMHNLYRHATPVATKYIDDTAERGVICIDLKTDCNMWAYKESVNFTGRCEPVDGAYVLDTTFPGVREKLTAINTTPVEGT